MNTSGATLIVIALLFQTTFQESTKIDRVRSFRGLAFGASPEQCNGDLKLDLTISYGLKYYKYRDKALSDIFGFKIFDANLGFRHDQLEYIDFFFNKLDEQAFDNLSTKLSDEFGLPKILEKVDEQGVVQAVEWKGLRTWVQLYRYDNTANDVQDRRKTVLMISNIERS